MDKINTIRSVIFRVLFSYCLQLGFTEIFHVARSHAFNDNPMTSSDDRVIEYCGMYQMINSYTVIYFCSLLASGLPTLLLTLAPAPSACSTDRIFFITLLAISYQESMTDNRMKNQTAIQRCKE